MNKMFKKIISAMLAVAVVFSCVSVGVLSTEALAYDSTSEYKTGDIIEFGSYPQGRVTDKTLIAELNSQARGWESYSYYRGTGSPGSMVTDGYMTYSDVSYGGNKYRGVSFDRYRPPITYEPFNTWGSCQQASAFGLNNVYWFKYEPLEWRVIDAEKCLVMCEKVIDSQAYSNTIYRKITDGSYEYYNDASNTKYANDYATSTIRKWLNDDFYNTAFTSSEKAEIGITTLDNSCYKSSCPEFDSEITHDKIFLLSYDEAKKISSYQLRFVEPTGYALCQGLGMDNEPSPQYGYSDWLLRSSSGSSEDVCYVYNGSGLPYYYAGDIDDQGYVAFTGHGIRPAFRFDRKTPDIRLGNAEAVLSFDDITRIFASENADKICVYPTTKSGEKVTIETAGTPIKVSSSGTYYLKYDAWHEAGCDVKTTMKIGDEEYTVSFVFTTVTHTEVAGSPAVAPTCTETGLTAGTRCEICGNPVKKQEKIPALGHSYGEWETTTLPTCTEIGVDSKICSVCGNVATKEIPALGHKEGEWTVVKPATKLERGEEELRCTVCTEILETREIPSISETLVSDEELMAIRGVAETKAYKDEDYIALVKRSGATSVGVYKETIDGYSVEITMQYGKINDTGTYYVAYESQNKTNPAGIMKVTYPDGTVKQSRVVFELYDIDMEVDINPAESVKPIRGKVSLQNDVAGDYILVQMSEGQTSVGMYKESLDETVLTLIETSGVVQEKDNWFISYGSQNTKNPEGRLHVVKSDGREATYRIVFRLFETDPDASLLRSLKAIRGTVTVENDGTEDYIRVKRSAGKTSVGLYKNTTAGIEYEITDSTGILQNKSSMYIAYRSQNEGDITGKINFKMPDGTIQTYKIIFSF